jgi:hypothetical protein
MNAVYSSARLKRRYEVWFLRCGLADGSGAWWFRYLLMNLGRNGCSATHTGRPAQVWATWFPRAGEPKSWIQGCDQRALKLSAPGQLPFRCHLAESGIEEDACWGNVRMEGHAISWNLRYVSNFHAVLSDLGWIGFCRSPHSDAAFSGEIVLDGKRFVGEPLGFGVQGHNCGYRHRTYWRWAHAYFPAPGGSASTLEALVYDMPFGMVFRKAVLWHAGKATVFRKLKELKVVNETGKFNWSFVATGPGGMRIEAAFEGTPPEIHRLPYTRTDCKGTFPVTNASLARASVKLDDECLETPSGAVLEMGGNSIGTKS